MVYETTQASFHFRMTLVGIDSVEFQEVSGLEAGFETDPVREGGEFVHSLPKMQALQKLVLKRGLVAKENGLIAWCRSTLEGDLAQRIEPKNGTIELFDDSDSLLCVWSFENAYPVKWQVGGLDAMQNSVALETVELAYSKISRTW